MLRARVHKQQQIDIAWLRIGEWALLVAGDGAKKYGSQSIIS
jgi:hypothetical protein